MEDGTICEDDCLQHESLIISIAKNIDIFIYDKYVFVSYMTMRSDRINCKMVP